MALLARRTSWQFWFLATKGNGAVFDRYSWEQTLDSVTVTIPVGENVRGKMIQCTIEPYSVDVSYKATKEKIYSVVCLTKYSLLGKAVSANQMWRESVDPWRWRFNASHSSRPFEKRRRLLVALRGRGRAVYRCNSNQPWSCRNWHA